MNPELKNLGKFLNGTDKVSFKKAPEPSDIIWENLSVTNDDRNIKEWGVVSTITLILLLSFLLMFLVSKQQM